MKKLPLCGDSLLVIFLGGGLMALFGFAIIIGIRASNNKAHQQISNMVYLLEILTVMPILCWRIYESCAELENMERAIRKFEDQQRRTSKFEHDFRELMKGYMHHAQ